MSNDKSIPNDNPILHPHQNKPMTVDPHAKLANMVKEAVNHFQGHDFNAALQSIGEIVRATQYQPGTRIKSELDFLFLLQAITLQLFMALMHQGPDQDQNYQYTVQDYLQLLLDTPDPDWNFVKDKDHVCKDQFDTLGSILLDRYFQHVDDKALAKAQQDLEFFALLLIRTAECKLVPSQELKNRLERVFPTMTDKDNLFMLVYNKHKALGDDLTAQKEPRKIADAVQKEFKFFIEKIKIV